MNQPLRREDIPIDSGVAELPTPEVKGKRYYVNFPDQVKRELEIFRKEIETCVFDEMQWIAGALLDPDLGVHEYYALKKQLLDYSKEVRRIVDRCACGKGSIGDWLIDGQEESEAADDK